IAVVDHGGDDACVGDLEFNRDPVGLRQSGEGMADDIGHCFVEGQRQTKREIARYAGFTAARLDPVEESGNVADIRVEREAMAGHVRVLARRRLAAKPDRTVAIFYCLAALRHANSPATFCRKLKESPMDISRERDGEVVIVRLAGRLDSSAAPAAEEGLL